MIRVLFVCTGNICRSPMAEGIFRHKVELAGLQGQIECDSAGTTGYHAGEAAHDGTIAVLERHGIEYNGYSRPLMRSDVRKFDYLIAMDDDHLHVLNSFKRAAPNSETVVARLLDYAPELPNREVPDPYYGPKSAFEEIYQMVETGVDGLLTQIRRDHSL